MAQPRRHFAVHYLLFRFLGLGWWHHPDEEDLRNFFGFYLYYAIITQVVWVIGFVGLESLDPFIGEKDMDRFMFSLAFVVTHDLTLIKIFIFFFSNRKIQEIVRILDVDIHRFYQNNEMNDRTVRVTRILTGTFLVFGWLTIANTDAQSNFSYILTFLLETIGLLWTGHIVMTLDSFIASMC
ncbi:uncharacterized protein LOC126965190 [Leptidea sinapis]|uniref:uncharacterized protein LOC126965190 n=1 Tax=Leptidea sinapis TaxID=189913 RepID=UPI0021C4397B|nr:uncharacterized protein LOC126965190 [Leptidea sinapis]